MGLLGLKLGDEYIFTRQFGAKHALIVLSAINLLNFADRYVPSAVKQLIIDDLHISDFESSLPATGMVVVYMVFAVVFGTLSDKQIVDRRYILVGAVAFWSVATSLAGLAEDLAQLVLLRSLVGVGEAAYGTIAPPMLSDFYPSWDRNVVYGLYYLAIPLGGALGYGIGAVLGSAFSWRVAFIAIGIPGIIVSYLILGINDPKRGINDEIDPNDIEQRKKNEIRIQPFKRSSEDMEMTGMLTSNDNTRQMEGTNTNNSTSNNENTNIISSTSTNNTTNTNNKNTYHSISDASMVQSHHNQPSWKQDLSVAYLEFKEIMFNYHFLFALGGLTANNFALGGLAEWAATFLLRYDDASIGSAGLIVGAATIIGGIGGNILGAKVADYFQFRVKSAYFLIPALFTIPAGLFFLFAINITHNIGVVAVLLVLGEICIWTYLAPISALSITVIPPRLRARSCGLQIFFQHILGDIISPPIIGAISDSTGSLQSGLQITWIVTLVSGLWWFLGYYLLDPLPTGERPRVVTNVPEDIGGVDLGDYHATHPGSDVPKDEVNGNQVGGEQEIHHEDTTYRELLCGNDPLVMVNGSIVPRDLQCKDVHRNPHHHDDANGHDHKHEHRHNHNHNHNHNLSRTNIEMTHHNRTQQQQHINNTNNHNDSNGNSDANISNMNV